MGSDSDVKNTSGAANDADCQFPGIEDLVGTIAGKMCCSLPQARLSLDAVLTAIRETPKPLRISGFGVSEIDGFRWFKCR